MAQPDFTTSDKEDLRREISFLLELLGVSSLWRLLLTAHRQLDLELMQEEAHESPRAASEEVAHAP